MILRDRQVELRQLRMWDGRLARWTTTDPYGQYHSPYLGMGNNPVSSVDPDGGLSIVGAAVIGGIAGGAAYLAKEAINGDDYQNDALTWIGLGAATGIALKAPVVAQVGNGIINGASGSAGGADALANFNKISGGLNQYANLGKTVTIPDIMRHFGRKEMLPLDLKKTIVYNRTIETANSTLGEFSIPGTNISGFILEPAGPSTTTANLNRRIPDGTYKLEWYFGTKYKGVLKLSNENVPAERAILIHIGNFPASTSGCLLPGLSCGSDFVGNSRDAVELIINHFREVNTTGAKIIIRNTIVP